MSKELERRLEVQICLLAFSFSCRPPLLFLLCQIVQVPPFVVTVFVSVETTPVIVVSLVSSYCPTRSFPGPDAAPFVVIFDPPSNSSAPILNRRCCDCPGERCRSQVTKLQLPGLYCFPYPTIYGCCVDRLLCQCHLWALAPAKLDASVKDLTLLQRWVPAYPVDLIVVDVPAHRLAQPK